ncbi:MAG: hypothetical protein L0Y57_09330, partial [Beijerinckiaceae bacterium]|nr:hypothetical protein [Beijerinckiaceae bacterium]
MFRDGRLTISTNSPSASRSITDRLIPARGRGDRFDQAVLRLSTAPTDTLFFDFHNASTLRLAVEFAPRDELAFRGGILYNSAAAPAVTVIPL